MTNSDLLEFHRVLLNDSQHMKLYQKAIRQAVRPDDVVLDAGTGTGILALFACQAGARRVYAIDRQDIIFVARQLAEENGFSDRIVFLQQDIRDVRLEEPVDIIISELISKSVLGQKTAEMIGWCRDHFLKPNGRILPEQVTLCAAPVESAEIYQRVRLPSEAEYQLQLSFLEQRSVNWPLSARISPAMVLARAQTAYLYRALTSAHADHFNATLIFYADRPATLHGFGVWFSSVLTNGLTLTNEPPGLRSWDHLFFPLPKPVWVEPETTIELHFRGWDDSKASGTWNWDTMIREGERCTASFRQSTFFGQMVSPKTIQTLAEGSSPPLSRDGKVVQHVLAQVEQGKLIAEIATSTLKLFSDRFASRDDALAHVRKIVRQFGA